jgi:hypothetical protein
MLGIWGDIENGFDDLFDDATRDYAHKVFA